MNFLHTKFSHFLDYNFLSLLLGYKIACLWLLYTSFWFFIWVSTSKTCNVKIPFLTQGFSEHLVTTSRPAIGVMFKKVGISDLLFLFLASRAISGLVTFCNPISSQIPLYLWYYIIVIIIVTITFESCMISCLWPCWFDISPLVSECGGLFVYLFIDLLYWWDGSFAVLLYIFLFYSFSLNSYFRSSIFSLL